LAENLEAEGGITLGKSQWQKLKPLPELVL